MKKFLYSLLAIFCIANTYAQKNIAGIWEGKLSVNGTSLRLVLHVQKEQNNYSATLDSPDQGAKDIKTNGAVLQGDSVLIEVPAVGGKISGLLINDTTFTGQWTQGISLPLDLKKVAAPSIVKRPQEPKAPFNYKIEELIYFNKDKSIQYGATLTMPNGAGPFPAMIFITGSGPQNRDEELFGHKPFLVLADYLTMKGYAVLRVDDRGVGKTTGDAEHATSKDFAEDVKTGLAYLQSHKEIDRTRLGMLGHSEGGMIAQIVGAGRKDIAFIISLAGPGQKITDLMADQNEAILKSSGVPAGAAKEYKPFYKTFVSALVNAPDDSAAKKAGLKIITAWADTVSATTKKSLFPEFDEASQAAFLDMHVKMVRSPWFKYFLTYDPAPYIQKLSAKVLALNGEKDIQVLAGPNLAEWKKALQKSASKKFDLVQIKGVNHLFQHCDKCTLTEYGSLEETFAPEAMEVISEWLKKNVK